MSKGCFELLCDIKMVKNWLIIIIKLDNGQFVWSYQLYIITNFQKCTLIVDINTVKRGAKNITQDADCAAALLIKKLWFLGTVHLSNGIIPLFQQSLHFGINILNRNALSNRADYDTKIFRLDFANSLLNAAAFLSRLYFL